MIVLRGVYCPVASEALQWCQCKDNEVTRVHHPLMLIGKMAVISYISLPFVQISVVPRDQYVIPEGQRVQEGSRQMRRKELYKPRGLVQEPAEAAIAAV
jgi:hypothetical protein